MSLKKIRHPELFQGRLDKKQYFEGWYFKHVDASGTNTLAFIPGISLDHGDSHSFVQVIVSPDIKTYYFRYPIEAFCTTEAPFTVTVDGQIQFSTGHTLDFTGGKGYIEKDWGVSFPEAYIWIQANHFEASGDSFMCSIATIPFGLFAFRGLIANLQGGDYRSGGFKST